MDKFDALKAAEAICGDGSNKLAEIATHIAALMAKENLTVEDVVKLIAALLYSALDETAKGTHIPFPLVKATIMGLIERVIDRAYEEETSKGG